jgi:hypothetical protein
LRALTRGFIKKRVEPAASRSSERPSAWISRLHVPRGLVKIILYLNYLLLKRFVKAVWRACKKHSKRPIAAARDPAPTSALRIADRMETRFRHLEFTFDLKYLACRDVVRLL